MPVLVVALLLLSVQPGVETATAVLGGASTATEADAVVVVAGEWTVPAGERARTSVYVVGGTATVDGRLDGRLVQLAGNVSVGPAASVTGPYRVLGGDRSVDPAAGVRPDLVAEPVVDDRTLAERAGALLLQASALGAVGFVLGRRRPALLDNVAHSVRRHPVVSGTVGLLASVSLLTLAVFMAFTLVLVPVSVLLAVGGVGVVVYGTVAVGHIVGGPVAPDRPGVGTAAGSVAVLAAGRVLAAVPLVGDLVVLAVALTGTGATLVTYLGLQRFEPPALQPVE